jgi:hypothetical protein
VFIDKKQCNNIHPEVQVKIPALKYFEFSWRLHPLLMTALVLAIGNTLNIE